MLFREYYNLPSFSELFEAVLANPINDTITVNDFLNQFESPYLALQMIIYAMIMNKTDNIASMKDESFKQFARYQNGKNNMTAFMASTRFPFEYAELFKSLFPESTKNPVIWAKEHKDITANLEDPNIQKLILSLVHKYLS